MRPYRSDNNATNEFWRYEFFLSLCEFSLFEMNALKKRANEIFHKAFCNVLEKVKKNVMHLLPQTSDTFRFEHLYKKDTDKTYKKWLNILKPGKLYLYYYEIAIYISILYKHS